MLMTSPLRVLSAALWRDAGNGALQNFEQCLLHALAADVTRDGRFSTF